MATLVLYVDGDTEYVTIDTADLSDADFEEEYGGPPLARAEVDDTAITPFPTDRGLREA